MAKFICYTSPARGHLFPTVATLLELQRRGHEIVVVTLASEVSRLTSAGLRAVAMSPAIEALELDDYSASSPPAAMKRAMEVFAARAEHEIGDLTAVIRDERPDALWVDFNTWGAAAVAEKSGLPWAFFMPYFLPWRLRGVPPFGPGLAPRHDTVGRLRDALVGRVVHSLFNRSLRQYNGVRARVGVPLISAMTEMGRTAPRLIHFTAEPFEYSCAERPASVAMVGPGLWEPPSAAPAWLDTVTRPVVLVTCSTEFQNDGSLISTALEGLANEDVFVVATTAAIDPSSFRVPTHARVERFLPHGPLLQRASCVVCHGGMGITQKALAAGVPVCVVPFGRDQNEVGRHVEVAEAGVRLMPGALTPQRLRDGVRQARAKKAGAERIAAAFQAAGGPARTAHELEALLPAAAPRRQLAQS